MDLILGIDFGTTNTVICYFENNKPILLKDGVYNSVPSKIGIKDNSIYCGNYIPLNVEKIIHSFKTNIEDTEDTIVFNNKNLLKRDLLLFFLEHIKKLIYTKFSTNIKFKTVITVPSNFNDIQREIIKECFNNCDFNVLRIINEPSAAALSYGLDNINDNEEEILVLDIGGGTLDISILLKESSFFEVKHSIGLNDIGGNTFTDCIYNYILKEYKDFDNTKKHVLWHSCQSAKEKLSFLDNYDIKIKEYNLKDDLIFNITTKLFEKISNNLINKIEELLNNIHTNFNSIKYIIMVGNTSKILILQKIVEDIFKIKPWIHPKLESVVAHGACLYGAITENIYITNNNVVLIDVLPLSLGVETCDGLFSIILPKNTPLPIKRTQRYTTDSPFENSIKVKIYQGERKIANKNTLIGEYIFDKISMGGTPIIDITFKVDLNGIINVIILDKKSNIEKNILIKDIEILDLNKLETILKCAEDNELLDENEMLHKSRLYQITTKIEIIINNIKLNNLINAEKKSLLLNNLTLLFNKSENADVTILLNILKELDEEYLIFITNDDNTDDTADNTLNDIDLIDKIILKEELESKINLLINKNPEWSEYLEPILEELKISNITLEYIKDKLEIIKDLEDDNDNNNYKEQYKNLCLYIKSEIEKETILLPADKLELLTVMINNSLLLLDNNNNDINWEDELIKFNSYCEELI